MTFLNIENHIIVRIILFPDVCYWWSNGKACDNAQSYEDVRVRIAAPPGWYLLVMLNQFNNSISSPMNSSSIIGFEVLEVNHLVGLEMRALIEEGVLLEH